MSQTTLASLTAASARLAATLSHTAHAVETLHLAPQAALDHLREAAAVQTARLAAIAAEARQIIEALAAAQADAQAALDALAGATVPATPADQTCVECGGRGAYQMRTPDGDVEEYSCHYCHGTGVNAPVEETVDLSRFGVPIRPATPEEEMDAIAEPPAEETVDLAAPTPEQIASMFEATDKVREVAETIQARAANAPTTNGRKRKSK